MKLEQPAVCFRAFEGARSERDRGLRWLAGDGSSTDAVRLLVGYGFCEGYTRSEIQPLKISHPHRIFVESSPPIPRN